MTCRTTSETASSKALSEQRTTQLPFVEEDNKILRLIKIAIYIPMPYTVNGYTAVTFLFFNKLTKFSNCARHKTMSRDVEHRLDVRLKHDDMTMYGRRGMSNSKIHTIIL